MIKCMHTSWPRPPKNSDHPGGELPAFRLSLTHSSLERYCETRLNKHNGEGTGWQSVQSCGNYKEGDRGRGLRPRVSLSVATARLVGRKEFGLIVGT